jgi:hypothetical protein
VEDGSGGVVLYGTDIIPSDELSARQPHPVQSACAATLAARLSASAGSGAMISKSHSRALVAAACAGPPVAKLGIDVEWMAPGRAFTAILRHFVPRLTAPVACDAFYRTWTFLEAHFKAYQHWPDEEELRQVLAEPAHDGQWQTVKGNHLIQRRIHGDFQLTVLWHSDTPCGIEYRR